MGARTLVAVEGADVRYDCYHSQWGGEHLERLLERGQLDDGSTRFVEREPLHTGIPADRVLSIVDSLGYEALVVQKGNGRAEAYLVCRLGVRPGRRPDTANPPTSADGTSGTPICHAIALVPWNGATSATRLRRVSRIAKGILGDAVDANLLPAWLASAYLGVRLARASDCPEDVIWHVPDDLG